MSTTATAKIYVSDLDGTLLRDDAVLSSFSRKTLSEMLRANLLFTVASARSVTSMRAAMSGVNLSLPVIAYNGSLISDLESGHHYIINSIDGGIVDEIYQLISTHSSASSISAFDGKEVCVFCGNIANEGALQYVRGYQTDKRLCYVEDWRQALGHQVLRFTIIDRRKPLRDLERALKSRYQDVTTYLFENRYQAGWYWLTVHEKSATKGQAIRVILRKWELDGSQVVAFGDSDNDMDLFRIADRAIAVGNATAELKSLANQVIGPNSEDSVVKFIRADFEK